MGWLNAYVKILFYRVFHDQKIYYIESKQNRPIRKYWLQRN